MVGQPVQQCAGKAFGAKDAGPLVKRQITGHQGGAIFVAPTQHFK